MLFAYLLLLLTIPYRSESHLLHLNLYHTDYLINSLDHDCLYYYTLNDSPVSQIHSYCIRHSSYQQTSLTLVPTGHYQQTFTFQQLKHNNITTDHLYQWVAPIDLIENYHMYLHNLSDASTLRFYNCTFPWFGTYCEYTFDQSIPITSHRAIRLLLYKQAYFRPTSKIVGFSCYIHMECHRFGPDSKTSLVCLDWREICDGKIDCVGSGVDEEECWKLDMNECNYEREFRCRNGLCIPRSFLQDDQGNPDCLDGSDERYLDKYKGSTRNSGWHYNIMPCEGNPLFLCEERTCHWSLMDDYTVACGQGDCVNPYLMECSNYRGVALVETQFTGINVTDQCYQAFICHLNIFLMFDYFTDQCNKNEQEPFFVLIKKNCPEWIVLPPSFFGHVQLIYSHNQPSGCRDLICPPQYICYNGDLCDYHLFPHSMQQPIDLLGNNSTCRTSMEFNIRTSMFYHWGDFSRFLHEKFRKCSLYYRVPPSSNYTNAYICRNSSQIISLHHLLDRVEDCIDGDDESYNESCSLNNTNTRFRCTINNRSVCLAQIRFNDGKYDCDDQSDEPQRSDKKPVIKNIFYKLCDGYPDLEPIIIDGKKITDESECQQYPCNNTYTRCDGLWNCLDGADEVNCETPALCPARYHVCISPRWNNLTCLPMERANDGIVDCVGATDERRLCRQTCPAAQSCAFQCWNSSKCISSYFACFNPPMCPDSNHNLNHFCNHLSLPLSFTCGSPKPVASHFEQLICNLAIKHQPQETHFLLEVPHHHSTSTYPQTFETPLEDIDHNKEFNHTFASLSPELHLRCNRGIPIRRRIDDSHHHALNNRSTILCLCPPPYYGEFCQYQNQRVSLIVQLLFSSDWRTVFTILITLRDNDEDNRIESYDNINYLPIRDCGWKFNIYLLYATRPKRCSSNYSVRIDIYNQYTLEFRASWLYPITYGFLPVYSLAVRLSVPITSTMIKNRCHTLNCGNHGSCLYHVNHAQPYCRCHSGWYGKQCDKEYTCQCSSDGVCLGADLCLCRSGKYGPRCYLNQQTCSCENNGTCVQSDPRVGNRSRTWCICPDHVSGLRCEIRDTVIDIGFDSIIAIPQSIVVHFVQVLGKSQAPIHSTTSTKIPLDQNIVTIYRSAPFHLLVVHIKPDIYHLILVQQHHIPSSMIKTMITDNNRCLHIRDLFDVKLLEMHRLQLMKHYHYPCRQRSNLVCFYDDDELMCLCNAQLQQANCFPFARNQSLIYDRENPCENGGRPFVDDDKCPTTTMCDCNDCFYGSRCQFTTEGYSLSLDVILGYQIRRHLSFGQQCSGIKVTTGVVTSIFICGFISNLISVIVFQKKRARRSACDFYLLVASYSSMAVMVILMIKFCFLILHQMAWVTDRRHLWVHCISVEYFLHVFFSTSDWLTACVSIERALTASGSSRLSRIHQYRSCKWITVTICLLISLTYLPDPIHRRLIDDEEEHRTWCVVQYSAALRVYNSAVLMIHFLLPFMINIISALVLIFNVAQRRSAAQKQRSYRQHLLKQFCELKHILLSPCVFVILAVPRLIISFLSGCMRSVRNPWLFLAGYLISFVPSMLIFVVFVLSSKAYTQEFQQSFKFIRRYIWISPLPQVQMH